VTWLVPCRAALSACVPRKCVVLALQGFEEGYTECCWPLDAPGVAAPASGLRPCSRSDQEERDHRRFVMLGNAVTVDVGRWVGERLMEPYRCSGSYGCIHHDCIPYAPPEEIAVMD